MLLPSEKKSTKTKEKKAPAAKNLTKSTIKKTTKK